MTLKALSVVVLKVCHQVTNEPSIIVGSVCWLRTAEVRLWLGAKERGELMPRMKVTKVTLKQLEDYGADWNHCSPDLLVSWYKSKNVFTRKCKRSLEWNEAIERGKARASAKCGERILELAHTKKDLNACLQYLKRHSDGWKDEPPQQALEEHGDRVQVVRSNLDPACIDRIVNTYLQIKRPHFDKTE